MAPDAILDENPLPEMAEFLACQPGVATPQGLKISTLNLMESLM